METQTPFNSVDEITAAHLCSGCGACASMYPDAIEMVDTLDQGRRPVEKAPLGRLALRELVSFCPGVGIGRPPKKDSLKFMTGLYKDWGPVLEIWEGYAQDKELRYRGSSGGLVTALSLYCLEQRNYSGVVHTRARQDVPYLNEAVMSHDRKALLAGSGSRYAPASPCEKLSAIETSAQPCVFIGKPCDVAATDIARKYRPELDENLGLLISIFCAGTPSTDATFDLIRRLGVDDPNQVTALRYRGDGWPGRMTVSWRGADSAPIRSASMSYQEGWGEVLQKKRQWRCHVCADHTGEQGDLSIGDPWYRPVRSDEPGRSLLLVRTEAGRRIVRDAAAAGYITIERCHASVLSRSQSNLLRTRGAVWGRIAALRLLGVAAPRYTGMALFHAWYVQLGFRAKALSILGTVRRVFKKGLLRPERWRPLGDDQC